MQTCERCGTRFGRRTTSEHCPRCLAREGVRVSLAFGLMDASATTATHGIGAAPKGGVPVIGGDLRGDPRPGL